MKKLSFKKLDEMHLNMLTMAIYQLTTAIFGFLLPNLILSGYGAELHGYTSTVTSIMSYIALLNAGLASAAIQSLYKPLADNDQDRINEVLNAVNKFYVRTGMLYTIAVVGVAFILPFVISNQLPTFEVISLMIVIGASSTLECYIYSKYRVFLQADRKLYIVSRVDLLFYLVRIISQILVIYLGLHIVIVMAIPCIIVVFRMIMLSYYCKKHYNYLSKKVKPDMTALSKRWSAMLHQIAGIVVYNTDVTILTIFTNLIQVSIYSVYNLVFSHIYTLLTNIFSTGTVATFGKLIALGNKEEVIKKFRSYEFVYYNVVAFIYSTAVIMILPFVKLYTITKVDIEYVDVNLAVLFIVIGIMNNLRVPCGTLINAAGHFKQTQWRAILEAIINITVSLSLVNILGVYGLLIGTICSFSYRTVDIICYSHKHILNLSLKHTVLRIMKTLVIIVLGVIIGSVISIPEINSWINWVIAASLIALINIIIMIVINFIFEFKFTINKFKAFLHK